MAVFKALSTFVLVALLSLGLASCARVQPVYNPPDLAVPRGMTDRQVADAIFAALSRRGWAVDRAQPHLIVASVHLRGTTAAVQIHYNIHEVKVTYLSSQGLKYTVENGTPEIHKNYNGWVHNLEGDIRTELSKHHVR